MIYSINEPYNNINHIPPIDLFQKKRHFAAPAQRSALVAAPSVALWPSRGVRAAAPGWGLLEGDQCT